tara:strand:+ start:1315 stop:2244 length:930 start_codon:yes stop_codon:yes gene_type:complete
MATSTNIDSTYSGEYKGEIISLAVLSPSTLSNGLIEVKPNINHKRVMKNLALGSLLSTATCDFTDNSSVTLTERVLTVEQMQVNLTLCKKDFQEDFLALEQSDSAHTDLPGAFAKYLLGYVAGNVAAELEILIWQATTAGSVNDFDGFLTLFAADADVIDVAGTTIDDSNVLEELKKIVAAIPQTILGKEDLFLYVSSGIYQAYLSAIGGFGVNGQGANGYMNQGPNQVFGGLVFNGIKIVPVEGMAAGEAVAARKSNLFFGTSLMADWQETKVLDMADLDGSQNVRIVMRMGAGVQYGIGSEIVYYAA